MTENKRFTITGNRSISDHQKKRLYDLNDFDGMISVTECLNELHEEKETYKTFQARWLLNQLWEQTQRFEKHNTRLIEENIRYEEHIEDLTQENKKLQSINQDHRDYIGDVEADFKRLEQHNKELQERNNRQAKQLDDIYRLIEEKDWRALSDIIDDFKKAEEQLQSEWGTYGDVE